VTGYEIKGKKDEYNDISCRDFSTNKRIKTDADFKKDALEKVTKIAEEIEASLKKHPELKEFNRIFSI